MKGKKIRRKKKKRRKNEEKSIFSLLLFGCRENEKKEKLYECKMTYISLMKINIFLSKMIQ